MNCPKCGNPISPNMKFCAKCGTPVVNANVQQTANHVQSANQTPQPADIQSKKKEKKDKKGGKNIALKIVAIILVIAVLASGGLILADNIMYKNEKVEADEYITDFPVLKTKTEFMVYDAKKFPAESYRIKVERLKKTAGILKSEAFRSTEVLFNKTSTEQIYEIDFKENGEYRITLTDITVARTQSTTGSAETTTKKGEEGKKIVVDVKVDNESAEAADKVNLNSEKLDAFPVPKTPLEELEGTYKGSYFPGQGETGLTLTVYKEGEQHKAIFDFYNLPGRTNSKSGKYYMNVTYNEETKAYTFTSYEWIEKPSTYAFVNLEGTLNGDVLSGESPTKFSVTRVGEDGSKDTEVKQPEDNLKPIEEIRYRNDGSVWHWYGYGYDSKGNVIKMTEYSSEGNVYYWYEYEYDAKANKIKETKYNSDGSAAFWNEDKHEYDEKGNKVKTTSLSSEGSVWGWFEYEYDAAGKETKKTNYDPDGGILDWLEYEYNSNGALVKETSYDSEGYVNYWNEYEYDSNGNEKGFKGYEPDGSEAGWTEYEYDANGNKIKHTAYDSEGEILGWVEYKYAEN